MKQGDTIAVLDLANRLGQPRLSDVQPARRLPYAATVDYAHEVAELTAVNRGVVDRPNSSLWMRSDFLFVGIPTVNDAAAMRDHRHAETSHAGVVGRGRIAAYAAFAWPLVAASVPLTLFIPAFYVERFGLPLAGVGMVVLLGRLTDALSDPLIGALSDRTRARFGRRRSWVAVATLPLIALMWLLFAPPITPTLPLFAATMIAFYLCWTAAYIPYQAHGGDLSSDYATRGRIYAAQGLAMLLATTGALAIPVLLFDPRAMAVRALVGIAAPTGAAGVTPYADILFAIAVTVSVVTPGLLILYLKSVPDAPAAPDVPAASGVAPRWNALREPLFLRLVGATFVVQGGLYWFVALLPFYLTHVLGRADLLLFALFVQQGWAMLMTPVWARIAIALGRGPTLALALAMFAVGLGLLGLVPRGAEGAAIVALVFLGTPTMAIAMLPVSMAADAADLAVLRLRTPVSALFIGTLNLSVKAGIAVGGLALAVAAGLGFDPGTGAGAERLGWLTLVVPALLALSGAAAVLRFPLSPQRHAIIARRLARRTTA